MMTGRSERRLEMSRRAVFGDRGISVFLRCQKTARETVTRRREGRIGDALDESGDGVARPAGLGTVRGERHEPRVATLP